MVVGWWRDGGRTAVGWRWMRRRVIAMTEAVAKPRAPIPNAVV